MTSLSPHMPLPHPQQYSPQKSHLPASPSYQQAPPPPYSQNPPMLPQNNKGHKSTCIRLESCMIALNSAILSAEAIITGLTLGAAAPITGPLMGLQAGLIAQSATKIARKKKARKYGM